jgi:nucleotide-binding universal stress UspA family protein
VPVDFSQASHTAVELALKMTAPWNSQVILFNAPGMSENDGFLQGTGANWTKTDVLAEAKHHLQSLADTMAPDSRSRIRIEARRDEDFVASVAHACEELGASLVIMGSPEAHRSRWRRSSAERVARAVHCPVLVVPM